MTEYSLVKLRFLSPLHIGTGKVNEYGVSGQIVHSDSLSAALVSVYAQLYSSEQADILEFMNSYKVSSLFPYYKNNLFFPKPLTDIIINSSQNDLEIELNKKIKKSTYLSKRLFEQTINGEELDLSQLVFNTPFLLSKEETTEAEHFKIWQSEVQQRVMVPRFDGGDSLPFYLDRLFFNNKAGLFFLFDAKSGFKTTFLSCLEYLGEQGIGTDKSVGNGQFECLETSSIKLKTPILENHYLSLSLYKPENKAQLSPEILNNSAYKIITRGGFMAGSTQSDFRHLRKKQINMFSEGSVFNNPRLTGCFIDLKPSWSDENMHPVYRDGRAFTLPIKVK
jgi:CRISPR type III-A-associated RAMP protein Csm4